MADQSHLDVLLQDVEAWNEWREQNPSTIPDLPGADLSKADLLGADLSRADLTRADLSEANLTRADLSDGPIPFQPVYVVVSASARLRDASLGGAILREADLTGANLVKANLTRANLVKAKLSGADLTGAKLSEADLSYADLDKAKLPGADLTRSTLVKTDLKGSTLTGCRIYGISAWSLNLKGAKQWNLNVSDDKEPAVMVDNLEVAQFIYLLLNHKKLRDVLNAITERGVLILGRFGGGGLEVLEAIAAKLRELKYQPFIFDFDRPADRNYTETVKTLVGLSRFVIVDLSGPSVPQELYATVPHFKIPFVPIIEEGRRQYSMAVDILEYPWVVDPPVRFVDVEHLVKAMPTQVIAPAEKRVKDRQDRLADLFDA
jgi:uncharacterized protein YjbI with pentapeptide repeats